jgi:hypothetical protein
MSSRRKALQRFVAQLAESIGGILPKGIGFTIFLFHYGERGDLAYASSAERADVVRVMCEFLEEFGSDGLGVELAPTVREAVTILRTGKGRGLSSALTPARALAMGTMMGVGVGNGVDLDEEEAALRAIALLELMIKAEPVADAELAAERHARRS